jgi:hypothetical protein
MWEYLTLYAKREDSNESYVIENYRDTHDRVPEQMALDLLGDEGWELIAVVPAYTPSTSGRIHHQLYFKRPKGVEQRTKRLDTYGR